MNDKPYVTKTESNIHFGQALNLAAEIVLKVGENPLYKADDYWLEIREFAKTLHKDLVMLQKEAYQNEQEWVGGGYKDYPSIIKTGGEKLDDTEVTGLTEEDNDEANRIINEALNAEADKLLKADKLFKKTKT